MVKDRDVGVRETEGGADAVGIHARGTADRAEADGGAVKVDVGRNDTGIDVAELLAPAAASEPAEPFLVGHGKYRQRSDIHITVPGAEKGPDILLGNKVQPGSCRVIPESAVRLAYIEVDVLGIDGGGGRPSTVIPVYSVCRPEDVEDGRIINLASREFAYRMTGLKRLPDRHFRRSILALA